MARRVRTVLPAFLSAVCMSLVPMVPPAAAAQQEAAIARPVSVTDYATTMKSQNGLYIASYSSDVPEVTANRLIAWKLKVVSADGRPVNDAEIVVSGDMPEHGHGLPTQPKITKNLGDGTYLVEGIKFSMNGWWTMTFTIRAAGGSDRVTFNLQLR